jgi:hypothetical protein
MSRPSLALAERFTELLGDPAMLYLTHWRMQVAARLLSDGEATVSAVALPAARARRRRAPPREGPAAGQPGRIAPMAAT